MFKKVWATIAFCQFIVLSMAQHALTVKITDSQQQGLTAASVKLDEQLQKTNSQGEVTFQGLQAKSYNLQVSFLGYGSVRQTVDPSKQSSITLQLQAKSFRTEEVFVTATRAKENSATTFKNLSKEEIRKNNLGQDIPFLLNQTPGVVVSSDAGAGIGYTSMTIRGSDNERINVTLNGIPLNDAESMGSFFVNLPDFASSVQSIQIQRGIGTSTNGAGAFGASLNIQTDALETQPYAELNNSFGSYNSWKNTLKVGSGLIDNKYAFNARLSRIVSDGYINRASSNLKSFYVDGGLYTDKHILKATVFSGKEKTYQSWYGTPEPLITGDYSRLEDYANNMGIYDQEGIDRLKEEGRKYNYYTYDNQTDNYTQTHSHLQYTFAANEKLNLNAALHYTRGAGYYEEFKAGEKFSKYDLADVVIGGQTLKKTDLVRRRWLDNHFYGLTYAANYKATANLNLTLGGAYNQYRGKHYGEVIWAQYASNSKLGDRYYFNKSDKNDFNIFAKADYRVAKFLFNLDLQYRNLYYLGRGDDDKVKDLYFEDKLNFFNPKVGATYFMNPYSNIYLSYAYGSKEPTRKDYVENPRGLFPKPEQMQDIEAGYRFKNEHFNVGANVYGMFYKNQLIPTGSLNEEGAALRINVDESYRMGVELDGTWRISQQFSWGINAALSDNKIKNFEEFIPVYDNENDWTKVREEVIHHKSTHIAKSPAAILGNNFTYKPIEALSFSLLSKYVSRIYLDNSSSKDRSIDPSFVHNFQAMYTFAAFGLKHVDLNLSVNNILNSKYETMGYTWRQIFETKGTTDHYNFYYPQAETNFLLGLNIRF